MKTILVRVAEPEDASKACEAVRRSIRELCVLDHGNDESALEAWLANKVPDSIERIIRSDKSWAVVAVNGDHVRGLAQFNASGELGFLYVDPEVRFQGVSRAMLRALEEKGRELGFERFRVCSTKTALRFYEAEGYRKTGDLQIGFAGLEVWPLEKELMADDRSFAELHLEEPSLERFDSYRQLVREFLDLGEPLVPFPLQFPNEDASEYLAELDACTRGEGTAGAWVAHSTYWLITDGGEVVGVSNLRHPLNDRLRVEGGHIGFGVRPSARGRGYARELLRLTIECAQAKGIVEILVTCLKTNERSARTIIANGGILDSEEFLENRGGVLQRYWIRPRSP